MSSDLSKLLLAGWAFQISLDAGSEPTEVFNIKTGKAMPLPVDSPRYLRISARHRHFHDFGGTFGLDYAIPPPTAWSTLQDAVDAGMADAFSALAHKINDIRPDLLRTPEAA